MGKKLTGLLLIILITEVIIFWWSGQSTDLVTARYSLAARWSARVSLLIFGGLSVWIIVSGLHKIYADKKRRQWFVLMIAAIGVNHLIHFIFLYINFEVNDMNLFTLKSAGGTLGYVIMTVSPIYLWNRVELDKFLYKTITGSFLFIHVIAILTYLGRWNKGLPLASGKEVYIGLMVMAIVLLIMNVYRIFADRKGWAV